MRNYIPIDQLPPHKQNAQRERWRKYARAVADKKATPIAMPLYRARMLRREIKRLRVTKRTAPMVELILNDVHGLIDKLAILKSNW
jgi:hypothetical protein